jgi:hypothetical protein
MHGVLPGPPGRWPRVTLLVNWWRSVPKMERAPQLVSSAGSWRTDAKQVKPRRAALASIEPSRLLSNAAWRDLIATQRSYR